MKNLFSFKKGFLRNVMVLVIPMAFQNLINVGIQSADVIMLGRYSEEVLAASSFAGQISFIMNLIFFGLTSGASVLTAQYWGKKDVVTIENIIGIALKISLAVSFVFFAGAFFFPELLMKAFTKETVIINYGADYLRIVSFSYVLTAFSMIYLNIIRSVEKVIISSFVYLSSFLLNIILNAILIFGLFSFPQMGIKGAAIATLIAKVLEFAIVFVYNKFYNDTITIKFKNIIKTDMSLLKDFTTYSLPVVINELVWGSGTSAIVAIIGHLGSSAAAANSVVQVTRQLSMVICFGIANATAILLGKTIGENKIEKAKEYGKDFVKLSFIMGIVGALVILIIRPIAITQMNLSDQAKNYMSFMMIVMSYFVITQAMNTTFIVGVFRAGGDIKFGLLVDSLALWGVSIFLGFIAAFVLKLDIKVVYAILVSDEIIKLPFVYKRYKTNVWLKNITRS